MPLRRGTERRLLWQEGQASRSRHEAAVSRLNLVATWFTLQARCRSFTESDPFPSPRPTTHPARPGLIALPDGPAVVRGTGAGPAGCKAASRLCPPPRSAAAYSAVSEDSPGEGPPQASRKFLPAWERSNWSSDVVGCRLRLPPDSRGKACTRAMGGQGFEPRTSCV